MLAPLRLPARVAAAPLLLPLVAAMFVEGCSLVLKADELTGGAPRQTDTGVAVTDTGSPAEAAADTMCDPAAVCTPGARVVKIASLSPCSATGTSDVIGCRQKVAAACIAANPCCFKGGFGPVDFPNADEATIACLVSDTYTAPVSEFVGTGKCASAAAIGTRACDAAVWASAAKRGLDGAILQSVSGTTATILGLTAADVQPPVTAPWTDLASKQPGCTGPSKVDAQECTVAVHRQCKATDPTNFTGFGPISWTATDATLVCFF